MEGADALAAYACVERRTAGCVEMTPDAEGTRCDSGKNPSEHIEFPHSNAAHKSEHAAKRYAGGLPGEGVDDTKSADLLLHASGAGDPRGAAEVMDDQSDVCKVESLNYCGECPRSFHKTDTACAQPIALTGSRGIETDATKIGSETRDNVAPNEGPEASMYKQ